MAILSIDTLSGCSSIPSFMAGAADTPGFATTTIFYNTNAPTSWTKEVSASFNNIALRVRGGAEGTAISNVTAAQPFTTVTAKGTGPFTSSPTTAGITVDSSPSGLSQPSTLDTSALTIQPATISLAQTPSHDHPYNVAPGPAPATTSPGSTPGGAAAQTPLTSGPGGGPGSHPHGVSAPHTHPLSDAGHSHPINATGAHTHSFQLSQSFDVLYVDVILATKD